VQVNGAGKAVIAQGAGSREDVNVPLGATISAGQIYYASFDVLIAGTAPVTNVYFAHFKDAGAGSNFNGRVFATTAVAGGDFTFGISDAVGTTPSATFGSDFSFGTTYRLVVAYNFDLGTSQLWVNPTSMASPSITSTDVDTLQAMATFAFRQAAGNTTQTIDNLAVATTFSEVVPEPSAALLVVISIATLAFRRRKLS